MMKQFQCPTHNQIVEYYCIDQFCQNRCLCGSCDHEHEKMEIKHLLEGNSIKEVIFTFQTFRQLLMDSLSKMELELTQNLNQLKSQVPNAENLQQLDKQLSEMAMTQNTLKQRISNRLQIIINAIKGQDFDQSPQGVFEIRRKEPTKSIIISQAQQQQEMIKKHRQSRIYKMNNAQSKIDDTQQLVQQPNFKADRIDVARLTQLSTQDWAWKMTSSTVFCCIFSALRDVKIIGFMQPCLYKSSTKNYQKKSAVINFGIYNKKNLTKQPIFLDKYTLRHTKMTIVNDCYEIMLSKAVELKEMSEYSIAIWPSKVLFSHYYSITAPVNPFIAFQTQDFNDSPKIKRSEDFPQVISTYRAGLIPYLIIDPRQ